jgi:hypothetical protein
MGLDLCEDGSVDRETVSMYGWKAWLDRETKKMTKGSFITGYGEKRLFPYKEYTQSFKDRFCCLGYTKCWSRGRDEDSGKEIG